MSKHRKHPRYSSNFDSSDDSSDSETSSSSSGEYYDWKKRKRGSNREGRLVKKRKKTRDSSDPSEDSSSTHVRQQKRHKERMKRSDQSVRQHKERRKHKRKDSSPKKSKAKKKRKEKKEMRVSQTHFQLDHTQTSAEQSITFGPHPHVHTEQQPFDVGKVTVSSSHSGKDPLPKRIFAPMTKEQYEKEQSVLRRVFDPETGRNRLIKGDGEIVEEIVSKDRHRAINKLATEGDGYSFQATLRRKLN